MSWNMKGVARQKDMGPCVPERVVKACHGALPLSRAFFAFMFQKYTALEFCAFSSKCKCRIFTHQ